MLFSAITADQIVLIVLVVLLVGVLVVMPIFTNKKRQQTVNTLHTSLKVGDKIMTIGGIIGIVKAINQTSPVDKEIIIETGVGENKTTMLLDIKALYINMSATPAPANNAANTAAAVAEPEDEKSETASIFEEDIKTEAPPAPVAIDEPVAETVTPAAEETLEAAAPAPAKAAAPKTAAKKTNSTKK